MTREKPYYKPCSTCTNEYCVFMDTEDTHSICEDYKPLEQEPCREIEDYENEIEDLHNRLDIAEYDKERLREEVTNLEEKIKALEQEPCEDELDFVQPHKKIPVNIEIKQEPKWIPVSERLPEETGTYITTLDYEEYGLAVGQRYYYGKGLGWAEEDCVIAWMPLPKPYKAESEV